jgi:hypothetical protein
MYEIKHAAAPDERTSNEGKTNKMLEARKLRHKDHNAEEQLPMNGVSDNDIQIANGMPADPDKLQLPENQKDDNPPLAWEAAYANLSP